MRWWSLLALIVLGGSAMLPWVNGALFVALVFTSGMYAERFLESVATALGEPV